MNQYLFPVLFSIGLVWGCGGQALQATAWASPGTDVFQAFTQHIGAQIGKDKQKFAIADSCTAYFYQLWNKKARPEVERIHFSPLLRTELDLDCVRLFPEGLEQAREAFGNSQQLLSLSLTFYQMALVGDGDDNQEYSAHEIHDLLEAFGLPYLDGLPEGGYVIALTGLFDTIRRDVQFKFLMEGMQMLMNKGYRFSEADQQALNQELN
ncbi:hypothetical protein ACTRXD_16075 [Nitrospira sp. T9]|uniref:hypothetical protein n=1 Tax=unclassified Nitrospira TaxID=2652172 RepID=UPI003F9DE257